MKAVPETRQLFQSRMNSFEKSAGDGGSLVALKKPFILSGLSLETLFFLVNNGGVFEKEETDRLQPLQLWALVSKSL